jgi:hypothetical protein
MLQDVDAVVPVMQCFDMLQQSGLHVLESLYPSETTRNHFSDVREGILHVLRRKAFNSSDVILKVFSSLGTQTPSAPSVALFRSEDRSSTMRFSSLRNVSLACSSSSILFE